jgi:geranylgeranyl pyrophosphate synthase
VFFGGLIILNQQVEVWLDLQIKWAVIIMDDLKTQMVTDNKDFAIGHLEKYLQKRKNLSIDLEIGKNERVPILDSRLFLHNGLKTVEQLMLSVLEDYHPDLKASIESILSAGGKRIRPRIILLIGSLFNAPKDKLIPLAASIELLHTATLVHDDLIDEALFRRGVTTLNSRWSPAVTVLTGDFVFASASYLASLTGSIEVMSLFSKTLMTIVNGELNQLFSGRFNPSMEDYYRRIYAKTASLFETSTHTAAIISHLTYKQIKILRKFGYELGMAFQIIDDILDYCGNQSVIGKPLGGDLKQGLFTLPILHFMKQNPNDKRIKDIQSGKCTNNEETTCQLVAEIATSSAIEKSIDEAKRFVDRAQECLLQLPDSFERTELIQIATFTCDRQL